MFPQCGLRLCRVPGFSLKRPILASTHHHHARRHRCGIAVEAALKAAPLDTPVSSSRPLPIGVGDIFHRNCAASAELNVHTTSPSCSKQRKVKIASKSFRHLSQGQRAHLTQLETLLWRRAPHTCRATSHTGQDEKLPCTSSSVSSCHGHLKFETDGGAAQRCGATHGELFVMSRVVIRLPPPTPSSDMLPIGLPPNTAAPCLHAFPCEDARIAVEEEVFTGVNHAFHKHVNPRGETLRGILKGCAEQNALGAAAASGCAYTAVTDVFVLAARVRVDGEGGSCADGGDGAHAASIFPCPECWRHLCHVARVRHQHALAPLRLFVCASSASATTHLVSLAQQRVAVSAEPMEVCIVTC